VLVLDACGVGALPDAGAYGDAGTNTLAHVAHAAGGLDVPALAALGLGSILPLDGVPAVAGPAVHGRLHPLGPGKDSVSGHWELMGVAVEHPLPTYPDGFPREVVARLERATGRAVLCNRPCDGIAAIDRFGAEHLRTGALILYTSQDSVLQLAAHADVLSVEGLYAACEHARAVMAGEHAVGRVIARPFSGAEGAFTRIPGRRDFSLAPPTASYLNELQDRGVAVHAVGKISDLFAGSGVDHSHAGATNEDALDAVDTLLSSLAHGLVFVNLVETDEVHGHRKDVHGFARALHVIDRRVALWLGRLQAEDLLILTADHGVDPAHAGSDHTREYAPLLAVTGEMLSRRGAGRRHDGPLADVGATVLEWLAGARSRTLPGRSLLASEAT
jgi:phosphopentomutase